MTDEHSDVERFFRDRLLAAGEALRVRGASYFALAPERSESSYWTARSPGAPLVFDIGTDLASELRVMWGNDPELHALADELAAISKEMAEERGESADVSSFIYAMF